jgi:MoxR-like ATPase
LPEAQLDRFLVKVLVPAPSSLELKEILARTTGTVAQQVMPVFKPDQALSEIARMQDIVRHVVISDPLQDVLVRIVAALTPGSEFATESVKQYVRFGPGPRGAQSVVLAAKVSALLDGRINISFDDIRQVLHSTLRHRLILQFQAEADGVSADDLIEEVRNAK